mmetsp:Transcript_23396/g.70104  ORF Transcript_23396/g.70104 Transcript_23396/m.70104 type:complete len:145 (-) Transcript_23396:9-443(-)
MVHQEICFVCGGPAADCAVVLFKSSTLQPRALCRAFAPGVREEDANQGVKFSMASLEKHSGKAPSTNRPIVCPACHPELAVEGHLAPGVTQNKRRRKPQVRPAVWSYNMQAHWQREHATTAMPVGLATAIELHDDEKARLKKHL